MTPPAASYRNLDLLADGGRWHDLLTFAATVDAGPVDERQEVAHVVALEAPAGIAAAAAELFPDGDNGYPGPLWEVVAQNHTWRELAPHLTNPRTRHLVAHTRVLHGEDLRAATDLDPQLLGAPLCLERWEGANWHSTLDISDYDRTGSVGCTNWAWPSHLADPMPLPTTTARSAQHDAVPFLDELSPATQAYAFHGTAWEAASMVATDQARMPRGQRWQGLRGREGSPVPFADVYSSLVHLATGDGPYARRTGQALGRTALWRALAAMAGVTPAADPHSVTALVERLHCVTWQEPDDEIWYLHLAMEDPEQGIAWVLTGNDFD
ncbi:DUF6183 family protein [Micromonospora parathelypteridis]|uniref:Uncharacterized protein n=1 Tax=Micromonospora parathelypteridis TaxID=1839617 RepID=A0A840W8U5_9ACTN|nr:DUF6183 family protein [Micromonospora parathelypteridis]MBB5481438.1 hypothetical protein [Micromonospora parathelypteridis]GGO18502.1 hypothetical protein GCM10011576_33560 [Micromonospora parathelypteridis]